VLVVVATMLFASSCSDTGPSGSGAAITFNIAVDDSELPAIEELLRRFQQTTGSKVGPSLLARGRSRPGPRINLSRLNATEVTKALTGDGAGIDLIAIDNDSLSPLLKHELVQELADDGVPRQVDVRRPSKVRVSPAGPCKQFFLPFRPNVRLTYARKSALKMVGLTEPPRSIAELKTAATRLGESPVDGQSEPRGPAVTLSLHPGDATAVTIAEWILSYNGDPLDLSGARSMEALKKLQRLWQLGIFSMASFGARYDTEVDYLLSGDSQIAQNWPYTSARLAEAGKLDEFSVHHGWAGPDREAHVIGGDVLAIPKGVEGGRRATAVALAQFLMTREAQAYLVRENAWPSIRSDAYRSVPPAQEETFDAMKAALAQGWFRPPVAEWKEVVRQMSVAVNRILIHGEDVASVTTELQPRINAAAEPGSYRSC